jgi:hypothetical protein
VSWSSAASVPSNRYRNGASTWTWLHTDQRLHPGEFSADEELSVEEFEQAWRRALQARAQR